MKTLALLSLVLLPVPQAQETSAPVLLPVNAKNFSSVIEKSKGRALVINLWASWCKPCVEEFPELQKLQRAYRSKKLDVIFISIDDDAKARQNVMAFLKNMKVSGRSYLKEPGDDEAFINAVNPKWSGSLPTTLIYDPSGRLVQMIGEQTSYFELEKLVLPILP